MNSAGKDDGLNTGRRAVTFFGVPLAPMVLVAVVFSAIGWIVENCVRIYFAGCIDARSYILPFISAYGVIPFAFHAVLADPRDMKFFGKKLSLGGGRKGAFLNAVLAFLAMSAFVFVAELIVGNLWDFLFGVELWDYSARPLKVTQYTCVPICLALGAGAFVLYKTVYARLLSAFCRAPRKAVTVLAWVFATLILLDTLIMIVYMAVFGEAPMLWRIQLRT